MVDKTEIVIIGGSDILYRMYEEIKAISSEAVNNYEKGHNLIIITEENSYIYNYTMKFCEDYHLHPNVFRQMYLSKNEVENSLYFYITPLNPLSYDGRNEKYFGTILNGGCDICNVGKKSEGDILVDRKYIKNKKFVCLVPDFVVSKEVKEIIEANKLTGVSFDRKVKDYKGRDIGEFFVMDIHGIMPTFNESTFFHIEKYCPSCGYPLLLSRSDLRYNKDDLVDILDFNLTKEYFNNSHMHGLIISKKALDVLKKNKIRFKSEPVILL